MHRRAFSGLLAASALPSAQPSLRAALITHAGGPHLSAYLPALAETPEISAVSVSDPSGEIEAAARKTLGVKFSALFRDPQSLLAAAKPQFALVTMEAALAPPAVEAALDAGCHVLAEKPACVRAADFARLAALAGQRRRLLVLALANRVDPLVRDMRRIVKSGDIGKIYGCELHIVADQTRLTRPAYHRTWIAQKARAGGGHLIWLGIHWLDLAMFITGSRIREVAGFAGNVGGQPIDTEDSAALALRFDNGTFGTLTSGYYLDKGYHSFLKFWGSHGWAELRKHPSPALEWSSTKSAASGIQRYTGPTEPSGYTPFVRAVARAAAGLDAPPLDAADSLHALQTVFAAYRAAETGRTQSVA